MINISQRTEPYELELPYGLTVTVKPLTTAGMAAAQAAALSKKPTPELKQMWRELYDKEPPGFSRSYLISRLAYRIQELAYGGLKPATRAKLDALADGLDAKAARKRVANGPVVGTQLIREWRGIEHRVTVLAEWLRMGGAPV